MKIPIVSHSARLIKVNGRFKLQGRKSLLGLNYWRTLQRYNSLEDFQENYKK